MFKRIQLPCAGLILGAGLLFSIRSGAALAYYLTLPGIPGESQNLNFPGTIEVQSFRFGVKNRLDGSRPRSRLTLVKNADIASPLLAQACANGGYLPTATLQVVRSVLQPTYQIKLDNVWVASFKQTNDAADENIVETVGLRYGKITWTYTQYAPNGIDSTDTTAAYDFLYGQVPAVLTVTGVQNPGTGTMDVTWDARAGATYNLLGSPEVDGPYALITTLVGTNLGPATVTLPASGDIYFYRLQEVP